MLALPIILRELHAESRQPFNSRLRMGAAAWSLGWFILMFIRNPDSSRTGLGEFNSLSFGLFALLWIAAPVFTFDTLSRERREGTLPLLFLTPLKPVDVVLGKAIVHIARAFSVWIASLPVLLIPVLMGGVGLWDSLRAALIQSSALVVGLACGLLASAVCTSWWMALALGIGLSSGIGVFLVGLHGLYRISNSLAATGSGFDLQSVASALMRYFEHRAVRLPWWDFESKFFPENRSISLWGGIPTSADSTSAALGGIMLVVALMGALWVMLMAARWIEPSRELRSQACPPRLWNLAKLEVASCFGRWKRDRAWSGSKSPMAWIGHQHWWWRLAQAVICLVICATEAWAFREPLNWFAAYEAQQIAFISLAFLSCGAAIHGFRAELNSGTMELILVSPLPPSQVLMARVVGIWRLMLPSMALIVVCWAVLIGISYPGAFLISTPELWELIVVLAVFASVPAIGTWCSLRIRNLPLGFLATLIIGVGLPALCLRISNRIVWGRLEPSSAIGFSLIIVAAQLALAGLAWNLALRRLKPAAQGRLNLQWA